MSKDKAEADKLRAAIEHHHAATATAAGGSYIRNDAGELVPDPSYAPVPVATATPAAVASPAVEHIKKR